MTDITKTSFFFQATGGLPTLDLAAVDKAGRERRAAEEAAWAKDHPPTDSWRMELEELSRRLRGYSTPEQVQVFIDRENAKHTEAVKLLTDEAVYLRAMLDQQGLDLCQARQRGLEPKKGGCGCDGCTFHRRLEVIQSNLAHAKGKQQHAIRQHGDLLKRAKELAPLVPRYRELAAKAEKIATARKVARGMISGKSGMQREGGMTRTPNGFMELPRPE